MTDRRPATPALRLAARVFTAAGLLVDAVVHLQLASGYQAAAPGGIGEGSIFRVEAVVAVLVALAVLIRPGRVVYAIAFVVAFSALAAVLLYRYVDVPALGPIPSMYEPVWFTAKTTTAVAEAVATIGAAAGLLSVRTRPAAHSRHR